MSPLPTPHPRTDRWLLAAALTCLTMPLLLGCAALAPLLGFATAAAPVAASALDLAGRLAPQATPADLAEIARRLTVLEQCDATKAAVLAPDAGPTDAQRLEAALIDSAAASRGLVDALAAARKDGGT